ncbi:hypothetical protein DPMN_145563 [Dreissena polymorpha]|nr:hypothetical protein DPMN_145563 [Dreissena polymorpha]
MISLAEKVRHLQEALRHVNHVTEESVNELNSCKDQCKLELEECTQRCMKLLKETSEKADQSNYDQALADLKERLVNHYKKTVAHVPVNPLMPAHVKPLTDIYVKPKLHKLEREIDNTQRKVEICSYKDVFYKGKTFATQIFLQGEAGTGKTTFAAKLVLDWCNTSPSIIDVYPNVETLREFVCVFHLRLTDLQDERKVLKMIKNHIINMIYEEEELNDAYSLLRTILKKEKCLVIEDGMDEWSDKMGQVAYPVMINCQHQWTVFITTRPWKLTDERIRNVDIDLLLELNGVVNPYLLSHKILGFFENNLLYIENQEFKRYIRNNKLDEVILSPMLLALCVCLWKDNTYKIGSSCDIYATMLDSLFKKVHNNVDYFETPPFRCFLNTKYIKLHIEDVNALSRAAFYLLFAREKENSLVFSDRELLNYISNEQTLFALKAGILSERKTSSLTHTYSFIHKSVQEFFAAYFIAGNISVINYQILPEYLIRYPNPYADLSQVFKFVCGMNTDAGYELSCLIDRHCPLPAPRLLQDIVVAGYKEAQTNMVVDCGLRLSHFNFVDQEETVDGALARIFMRNIHNVRSLSAFCYISPEIVDIISDAFHLSAEILTHLTIYVDVDVEDCQTLDLSSCHNLESISITGNVFLVPSKQYVLQTLKYLNLHCFCECLDLSNCHSLETLSLGEHVTLMPDRLCELTKLKKITIHCNCDFVDLSVCSKLEAVEIKGTITVILNAPCCFRHLKHIALTCSVDNLDLTSCRNLETVFLRGNVTLCQTALLGLDDLQRISLLCNCDGIVLSSCRNLQYIVIVGDVSILPNQFQELTYLKHLMLCCNSDMLDLSYCRRLEAVFIKGNVTLFPNSFTGCSNLQRIKLLCNCSKLDLSSCVNLETIYISGKVNVLPNSMHNLNKLKKLKLVCDCERLDLIDCYCLETVDIRGDVTLLPNAIDALTNLKRIKLMCKCDGLDLSSCSKLEAIFIKGEVSLLPHALVNLHHLRRLSLNCKSDGLALPSCYSLRTIYLDGEVTLERGTVLDLLELKNLTLRCRCDMLDLARCPNLETLDVSGKVNLVAGSIVNQQHLKYLSLRCNCDELIFPLLGSMKTSLIRGKTNHQ